MVLNQQKKISPTLKKAKKTLLDYDWALTYFRYLHKKISFYL